MKGGCNCGAVRYRLTDAPILIEACHCHWCQRETASAFGIYGIVGARSLTIEKGEPETVLWPSHSGMGQQVTRCASCNVVLWSVWGNEETGLRSLRVASLDDPFDMPPILHIFTATKLSWVQIPEGVPAFAGDADRETCLPADILARLDAESR